MHEQSTLLLFDVGSTTTKAVLIHRQPAGSVEVLAVEHAPTTVERPHEDVMVGVRDAAAMAAASAGVSTNNALMYATSSAGGGLQMIVAGTTQATTAGMAERVALGAGAIVLANLSADDGHETGEKVDLIRELRPDMILIAGGVDGGDVPRTMAELVDMLASAGLRARLGETFQLPIVYAGNEAGFGLVRDVLGEQALLVRVENLMPGFQMENFGPARAAIHELFQNHVMQHAPGFATLAARVDAPVMPTPAAMARAVELVRRETGRPVMTFDIGGATTDVFSVSATESVRSVSANLGMSYSALNVLALAGIDRLRQHLPGVGEDRIRSVITNKTVRPTALPETAEELAIEQAVASEALRLATNDHVAVARDNRRRAASLHTGATLPQCDDPLEELFGARDIPLVIGSGGVLSFAPQLERVPMILGAALTPRRPVEIACDRRFLLPQVGLLSGIDSEAATDLLHHHCLRRLTTIIPCAGRPGSRLTVAVSSADGVPRGEWHFQPGDQQYLSGVTGDVVVTLRPTGHADCGWGMNKSHSLRVHAGEFGPLIRFRTVSDKEAGSR
ncbi:MAG: glutamate mutase L [Chloroflexota bacterium]